MNGRISRLSRTPDLGIWVSVFNGMIIFPNLRLMPRPYLTIKAGVGIIGCNEFRGIHVVHTSYLRLGVSNNKKNIDSLGQKFHEFFF